MGQGYHHVFFSDEVLYVYLFGLCNELCAPFQGVLIPYFLELGFYYVQYLLLTGEDFLVFLDLLQDLFVFFNDLFKLEACEALEFHVQDGLGLYPGQLKLLHEAFPGLCRGLGGTDECHNLVQVVNGNLQAFQDMGAFLGLSQQIGGAPDDHRLPVFQEVGEKFLEVQQFRFPVDNGQEDDAETALHCRVFVKMVEDDLGNAVLLELHHYPHAAPVGFIPDRMNALYLLVLDQRGNALHELGLVYLIGYLGDDDLFLVAPGNLFHSGPGPHLYYSAARLVGLLDPLPSADVSGCGKIRAMDMFHEFCNRYVGVFYQGGQGIYHLPQVVRRYVGGHAHCNS